MINMLKEGDNAPDFELPDQDGKTVKLSQFKGQRLLVYFYPKDNSPSCTLEAVNFRDSFKSYEKKGFKIIGISKDSVASHKKFATKHNLPFTLLSDKDLIAAKAFGALEKGKVKRRSWIIDENWKIEKVYGKVSPSKHNQELIEEYGIN